MKKSSSNNKILAPLIACLTILGLTAMDIYTPSLPAVGQTLAASTHLVQLTITIFLIAMGFSQLIYGPLSDYFGRRPVLMTGLLIYLAGTFLCMLAPSITILLLARFIQGVGAASIMSLNRVIIKDSYSGIQLVKVLSYIAVFITLAPALAPAIGGFIQDHWGWRWSFALLLIYGAVIYLWCWFSLIETNQYVKQFPLSLRQTFQNYGIIVKNRIFWANCLTAGVAFSAMLTFSTMNPYILETTLGKTASQYGLWAMLSSSGFLIGMLTNVRIVERLGSSRTLVVGNFIILSMALILVLTGCLHIVTISAVILPTIGIGFGIALVFPNAFVGAMSPFQTIVGSASAVYGCLQVGASFATSLIITLLSETTQLPMGLLILSLITLSIISYSLLNQAASTESPIPIAPQESEIL